MADRQHQQVGLKLQSALSANRPLMKSERPIAQVAQPSAAGGRGVGKTLCHIATKLAALRVDGTVRAQRLRIGGKGRLTAVPAIEGALFITGQLHTGGRDVNPVRRLRGGVGHPGAGSLTRLQQRHAHPVRRQAQQLNRHRRAAEAAADNHDMRFCTHRCPPPVCCLMVALLAISWRWPGAPGAYRRRWFRQTDRCSRCAPSTRPRFPAAAEASPAQRSGVPLPDAGSRKR